MRSKTVDRLLKSTPKDVEIFVDWYADLVVLINQLLREQGINKKDLAQKLDKNPSEISKWLNGEHNFTLRSLAKLSAELGVNLIEVPRNKVLAPTTENGYVVKYHTFVSHRRIEVPLTNVHWQQAEESEEQSELSHAG